MKKLYIFLFCGLLCAATLKAQTVVSGITGPLTWEIAGPTDNYTLTISGTGAMPNYAQSGAPWYSYRSSITAVNIGSSVTTIGAYAFYSCGALGTVSIPNSVTSIGQRAFTGSGIKTITIPDNVETLGLNVFSNCSRLVTVNIGKGVKSISSDNSYSIFDGCTSLTGIFVSSDNADYYSEDGVLFNSPPTTLLAYPAGKQGTYTIPSGVNYIGASAFNGCAGLTGVIIPASISSIRTYGFYNCTGLTSVTSLSTTPPGVASDAFIGCATNFVRLCS